MCAGSEPPRLCAPHLDPEEWNHLIEALGRESLVHAISRDMSSVLRGLHEPEDLLQDALALAWRDRSHHHWRGLYGFRSWLLAIAHHCILAAAERALAKKRPRFLQVSDTAFTDASLAIPESSPAPDLVVELTERASLVAKAVARLRHDQGVVVQLHALDAMPMNEVANRIGVKLATCWSRFRQGLRACTCELEQVLHGGAD